MAFATKDIVEMGSPFIDDVGDWYIDLDILPVVRSAQLAYITRDIVEKDFVGGAGEISSTWVG